MSFEKDYNKLIPILRLYIKQKKCNLVEPEDLISDAYSKNDIVESNYNFNDFLSACKSELYKYFTIFEKRDNNGRTNTRYRYRGDDNKTCKDCKDVLPIEMFRSFALKNSNNMVIKRPYCKKCENKRTKICEKKRRIKMTDSFIIELILKRKSNPYSKDYLKARPKLLEIERKILLRKRNKRLIK